MSETCGCPPPSQSGVKGLKRKQCLSGHSDNMCSGRVFIGRFELNERKKRTGLVSGTGHETHWPLDPKKGGSSLANTSHLGADNR